MARRSNDPTSGGDKAKVRVVFAEVEGNNESVQEALRTMVSAMSRPVRVIQAKAVDETPGLTQQDLPDEVLDGEALVHDEAFVHEESSENAPNGSRKPRGSGPKVDRNAGISLVPNLNFRPEGHPTLRDFFAGKIPSTDMEQILVVVYYMQHSMGLSKIGLGHIRTALNDVSKSMPLDLKATVRNMKRNKAWLNFSNLADITTATAGDNHVLHDMGKKS